MTGVLELWIHHGKLFILPEFEGVLDQSEEQIRERRDQDLPEDPRVPTVTDRGVIEGNASVGER